MKITKLLAPFVIGVLLAGCNPTQNGPVSKGEWDNYFDAREFVFNNSCVYAVWNNAGIFSEIEIDHGKVHATIIYGSRDEEGSFFDLKQSTDTFAEFSKITGKWYELDDPKYTLDYFFLQYIHIDDVFEYSDFSYDSGKNVYTSNKTISHFIHGRKYGSSDYTEDFSNVVIKFNSENQLTDVECDVTSDGRLGHVRITVSKHNNITVALPEADVEIQ